MVVARPKYYGKCGRCTWQGPKRSRFSEAEEAAKDHTRSTGHKTWLMDQYDLRVTGSTIDKSNVNHNKK